ncbi:hypothetical protein HYU50_03840 [Candidatus Woesearchaeota archaeon]|nr:hypothetical protein [Candidatus Woesearchaeota archaeon]
MAKHKMAKKRGKAKVKSRKSTAPKKPVDEKTDVSYSQKAQEAENDDLNRELESLEELRSQKPVQKEEQEEKPRPAKKFFHYEPQGSVPSWFYIGSVFAAYLFTVYISIFATIHFGSIEYMNITVVFLFISLVSFFLVSAAYLIFEKKSIHSAAPILFFAGITSIMIYAFKATDTSNLVRYSIIYAIVVAAISIYVLAVRRKS